MYTSGSKVHTFSARIREVADSVDCYSCFIRWALPW